MRRFEATIDPIEVPVIRTSEDMLAAAADLATRNCAYVVPEAIETSFGPLTDPARKINALTYALEKTRGKWTNYRGRERTVTPDSDIGMHGNPFNPARHATTDYLHYHQTPSGVVAVTFAQAGAEYRDNISVANGRLSELLHQGKTDTRYAQPDTFRRAEITPGQAVVFRLNDPSGEPQLHDFTTLTDERVADITAVTRTDDAMPYAGMSLAGLLDEVERVLHQGLGRYGL